MSSSNAGVATLPVVRALLDEARRKHFFAGALGIHARPEWTGSTSFDFEGVPVIVMPCVSTLAVREALRARDHGGWLVILTDRDDADLGAGVRSHLVWHRLRTPDPWNAVQGRFSATGLDPALTSAPGHRDLAVGLLACIPADGGWPPAPGGVLTRDHALGSVAHRHLHLPVAELSPGAVLAWTAQPQVVGMIADLRGLAGDPLADAVLDWVTRRVGAAAPLLLHLLRNGQGRRVVPLGLVLQTLLQARSGSRGDDVILARVALARLEPQTGAGNAPRGALESWAAESYQLVSEMLRANAQTSIAERLLVEADALLAEVHANELAECSVLLPAGLSARLARLAAALRDAVTAGPPTVAATALQAVETAWTSVGEHALSTKDGRVSAFRAAVRLTRWLAVESTSTRGDLTELHARHLDADAWVDSAVNDAAPGVGDAELGAALSAVLMQVRKRRDRHDEQYARALAGATRDELPTGPGAVLVEDLLTTVVLPLAARAPVLLLVLDGMSAAVGCEIVESVVGKVADGWSEALPDGRTRRIGAVAALPSITDVSRASLLCGELRTGGQDVEQRGYAELVRANGLAGARLFHKKPLDSSQLGFAVADDVGAAIDDKTGQPLVTCILNTIDDALDRSDPAGTVWTAEAVKHLGPLLDRARIAGRVVVLTSDHGHIVERRHGVQRSYPVISSGRSRAEGAVGDGELLVAGRRVLLHDGRAVLAVDERLRYGPLKAGYHGGGAPAEVVIPVYFLVSGGQTIGTGLLLAPPQEPAWWSGYLPPAIASAPPVRAPAPSATPTLFDPVELAPAPTPAIISALAAATIASPAFAAQQAVAGRLSVTNQQVTQLLAALLAAPDRRLAPTAAALAIGVPPASLRGAVLHTQRLLNLEGFAVLSLDADGATVILDEALLRDQFELPP